MPSAAFGFGRVKAFAVARHQRLDHRRFRLVGLKQHAAGLLAPARPSGDLLYLLKGPFAGPQVAPAEAERSEEHTSELQSLMRISYAVFCLKKKNKHSNHSKL